MITTHPECKAPNIQAHSGYAKGCRCERCAAAHRNYSREYRSKPENQERRRARQRERYARHTNIIKLIKAAVGCRSCGISDWRVLDFDHIDPQTKNNDVGSMMRHSGSFRWLMSEIEKCQILCSNCHRIKTIEALNGA